MNKQLAIWVVTQRQKCEREDRRKMLDSIGFVRGDILEAQQIEKFNELRDFKKKYGHTKVTMSMDKQLAIWVKTQRSESKREDRIKCLILQVLFGNVKQFNAISINMFQAYFCVRKFTCMSSIYVGLTCLINYERFEII